MATAKIYCKVGDSKRKSVKSKIKDGTLVKVIQEVSGVNTVIAEGIVRIEGAPPPPPPVCPPGQHLENGGCVPDVGPPPPPTGDVDKFGIKKSHQSTGREWFNSWDNGHARKWGSNGTDKRNADPDDAECDLHCKKEERGIVTYADVDGNGICELYGTTPRLYINDSTHVLRWLNVEMTVYFFIVKKLAAGGAYVACRLAGRSNHQNEYNCSASGTGYGAETKNSDGTNQIRRENGHPAYSDNKVSNTKGVEAGKWIGKKLIVKTQPDGSVLVQHLRDLTDGANGGDWKILVETIDRGDWPMTDTEDKKTYDGIKSCSEFKKVALNEPLKDPAVSCYLRIDNNQVKFKWFSVREI